VKFKSQVYTQASGSIGGVVYSHNRGGMYTRGRAIPVNSNTIYQQAIRNAIRTLTSAWTGTLTPTQRAAWAAYANAVLIPDSLGEPRKLPPLAMFCRCNVPRLVHEATYVPSGPTVTVLPTFTAPVLTVTAPTGGSLAYTVTVGTDDWAREVGGHMYLYCSRPQGTGIGYFKGPYRYCDKVDGAVVPPTSPKVVVLPFPVVAGQNVFYRVNVSRADGGLSSSLFLSDIAA